MRGHVSRCEDQKAYSHYVFLERLELLRPFSPVCGSVEDIRRVHRGDGLCSDSFVNLEEKFWQIPEKHSNTMEGVQTPSVNSRAV